MGKELRSSRIVQNIGQTHARTTTRSKEVDFSQEQSSTDPEMTSSIALHDLHLFLKEKNVTNLSHIHKKTQHISRICKKCDKWDRLRSMKTCERCEDHYHKSCHNGPMKYIDAKFVCQECQEGKPTIGNCKVCSKSMGRNSIKSTC